MPERKKMSTGLYSCIPQPWSGENEKLRRQLQCIWHNAADPLPALNHQLGGQFTYAPTAVCHRVTIP